MSRLSDAEIDEALSTRAAWQRAGDEIRSDRTFPDFAGAMAFVNRVAQVAEERNHHPDILVHGWNNVQLRVSTHSEGGITAADVALADALDALA